MNISEKSLGILLDEFIVNLIQYRAPDETFCAGDNNDGILDTILSEINESQLKSALSDIIKLAIEHAMIYFNRRFLIYSNTQSEALSAARRVNEINSSRINLVRSIDKILDPDHLTFSPKTYGSNRISKTRTSGVIVDDFISSLIKFQINDSRELSDRINKLSDYIDSNLANIEKSKLIKLAVAGTMCFFVHDILSHSTVDSEAIQAGKDIILANKLRKEAIMSIGDSK